MTHSLGTVMIIDDEEIDQRQYKRLLTRSEMTRDIIQFTYADEALEWLERTPEAKIDLILLDVNIPRMNGFEFLDAIGERFPEKPLAVIIMLTTSLDPTDRDRAFSYKPVRGFFSKPLTREQLDEAVLLLEAA